MPVSTSAKPCSSNHARTALVIAPRASRNGLRSACRAADHHGDGLIRSGFRAVSLDRAYPEPGTMKDR